MVHLDSNTHLYEKLLDFAPQVVEKIQEMMGQSNQSSGTSTMSTTTSTTTTPPPNTTM